jgi:hypothetical protein
VVDGTVAVHPERRVGIMESASLEICWLLADQKELSTKGKNAGIEANA